MTSIQFTDDDRDSQGFIKTAPLPTRTLAELLSPPAAMPDLTIKKAPFTRAEWSTVIAFALGLIVLIAYTLASDQITPAVPLQPTHGARGGASTVPTPIALTPIQRAARALIAYASPAGAALGAIESTRAITPTAHYGSDWIQASVSGSGLVWLRTRDAPDLQITGPDLAPPPTVAPEVVPAAAPFVPEATDPPPVPTQCAEVGVPGKQSRSCGTENLSVLQERAKQIWLAAFGGNIGIVTTPTPYGGKP